MASQSNNRNKLLADDQPIVEAELVRGPIAEDFDENGEDFASKKESFESKRRFRLGMIRTLSLFVAAIPIVLLIVASRLEPSSSGLGTHQQLGLPPCSMRVIFGVRCPSCGMTTSWSHFTRGEWRQSFHVNPGGFLLAGLGIYVAWLAMQTFWTSRLPSAQSQRVLTFLALGIMTISLLDWIRRLAS